MIDRYTLPEMGRIWSLQNKFRTWWLVELEVCRVQCERGVIPQEDFKTIEEKAEFDIARILEIEDKVKHDVIAFLTDISGHVGPAARHIHKGMTSSDLLDTALAVQIAEAGALLAEKLEQLEQVLTDKAHQYKDQLMVGRTHGIHAEPITLGLKILIWREEIKRHMARFRMALNELKVGKISGAVGTYQHLEPAVEARVCENLGLTPALVSNQIVQRDRHAAFINALALIGATLEKMATEIRHLQRTEVLEAEEYFSKGQKGSSAMPHKRNPILSERVCGLARLLRGYAITAFENVSLWHERDISHSSAERVIMPDACITLDFLLYEMTRILDNLVIYPEQMRRNLFLTRGLIFSQEILLALIRKGLTREKAYQLVQHNAMQAWQADEDFKDLLKADQQIKAHLDASEIEGLFDLDKILERVNFIFNRLEKRRNNGKEEKTL